VELTPPRELALLEFLLRRRGEVVSQREILELLHRRLRPGSAEEQLDHSLADAGQVGAELHEHLGGDALTLADQAEQQVLGADVVVVELERLAKGELQDLLGPRRERDVADRGALALPDDLLDLARTTSSEMPSDSSAFTATPSPSRISPSSRCSVPR
jgi:hypothetical protein